MNFLVHCITFNPLLPRPIYRQDLNVIKHIHKIGEVLNSVFFLKTYQKVDFHFIDNAIFMSVELIFPIVICIQVTISHKCKKMGQSPRKRFNRPRNN